jgi:phosphatidylglycerophosphatase A
MSPDRAVARAVATWFGCGFWPWGPGTVGAAAAVVIAAVFDWAPMTNAIAGVVILLPAIWASSTEADTSGRKDPGHVVVDEVVGQWITLAGAASLNWKSYLIGFALFRLFDIWKPPPVRQLEALPNGVGIMADDVMAGVYGAVVLAAFGWLNLY